MANFWYSCFLKVRNSWTVRAAAFLCSFERSAEVDMWSWWLGSHHPPWMGTSSWVQSWSQAWCRFDSHLCPYPCGSPSKESACNAGDLGSISVLGRSPGEGKGYPLQYSGLENSMDCIVYGVSKSWTWLSDFYFTSLLPLPVVWSW